MGYPPNTCERRLALPAGGEEESEELIEESEDEIEESHTQQIPIYFSDLSSGEDEWKDTPTYVMNIIYNEQGV